MSTWHNSFQNFKEYRNIFDFGCSLTSYKWLTWSDMIAVTVQPERFFKTSQPGSGLKMVYHQLRHVAKNRTFTDTDLVLVCLPTLDRYDILNNGEYKLMPDSNRIWSSSGGIALNNYSKEQLHTSFDYGYKGEAKFNLANLFMDSYVYLDLIIDLFKSLPCDKVLISSDIHKHDANKYIWSQPYQKHISEYHSSYIYAIQERAKQLSTEYQSTIEIANEVVNYDDFYCRLQVQKYGLEYEIKAMLDPHPSPDEAYAFVCDHIFKNNDHECLSEIMPVIMDNYTQAVEWCMTQPDPHDANHNMANWMENPEKGILDIAWALGDDKVRATGNHNRRIVHHVWPHLSFKDAIHIDSYD